MKIRCYDCKRSYDYEKDCFCPRCGAFNLPPRTSRIDQDGRVVRQDGLNEDNHAGSFLHKEFHRENLKRAFTPLEKGSSRPGAQSRTPPLKKKKGAAPAVVWIWILLMILLSLFD